MFRLLGKKFLDGFTEQLPEYLAAADAEEMKEVKKQELDKFIAVLFLRNASQERFGELLVEYRKAFANKDTKYPQDLNSMMDVMRQQPSRKKKKITKTPKSEEKDEEGLGATSLATTDCA